MPNLLRANEPDGPEPARADEDDVEGHGVKHVRATEPDGVMARVADDEDDVEGHFGQLKSPRSRGE